MEKYIWLTKKCKKHCPSCTGERMEHPHHNIEDVLNYQDFFIQEKYDFIADNIVKVLLSNLDEPYIYAFVDKKNLFILAQLLSIKVTLFVSRIFLASSLKSLLNPVLSLGS